MASSRRIQEGAATRRFGASLAAAVLIVSVAVGGCTDPWKQIDPYEEFACDCETVAQFVGGLPGVQDEFSDVSIYVNQGEEVLVDGIRSASFEDLSRLFESLAEQFPDSEITKHAFTIETPNWVLHVNDERQRPVLIVFTDFEAAGLPEFSVLDKMDAEERESVLEPLQDQVISRLSDLETALASASGT